MRSLFAALLAASSLALAQAVPERLLFNARLADASATPLGGTHAVKFELFDAATGATALWTEERASLTFTNEGLAWAELGEVTPLTSLVFDGRRLFLQLTVDGVALTPRLSIASVPYALRATSAAEAARLGSFTANDLQRRVASTCAAGSAIRAVNVDGTVTCETGATGGLTALTAGSGLVSTTTGSTANVELASCARGGVLKSTGSGWGCSDDRGYATESELTAVLDDNYKGASWAPSWSDVTNKPTNFVTGAQACVGTAKVSGFSATGAVVCSADALLDQASVETWARAACFDTEAELTGVLNDNYAAATHSHAWGALTSVPAGFADGVDNDTTYLPGTGLTLTGSTFNVNDVTGAQVTNFSLTGADVDPATTLDVANIIWSTPRVRQLVVGEADFRTRVATSEFSCCSGTGGAFISNAATDSILAPVAATPGVTITQFIVYFTDNEAALDLRGNLYGHAVATGGYQSIEQFASTGAATGVRSLTVDVDPDYLVPTTSSLTLSVFVSNGTSMVAWSNTIRILGARIYFTEPGPI